MIGEIVALVALVSLGECYLRLVGVRSSFLRAAAALPSGAALTVTLGLLALMMGVRARPAHVLLVGALGAVGVAIVLDRRVQEWIRLAGLLVAVSLLASIFRMSQMVNLTPDSYDYAWSGSLFAQYGSTVHHQALTLERRSLALSYLHGIAGTVTGDLYLASLGPLLAISGVALLWWVSVKLLRLRGLWSGWVWVITTLTAAFAASTNRFVYHAFYLNSHMLFAVLAALFAGMAIISLDADEALEGGTFARAVAPLLVAMVLLRPEGALIGCLLVAPVVFGERTAIDDRARTWLLASLGIGVVLWNGGVLWPKFGEHVPVSVIGMTFVGGALLVGSVLSRRLARIPRGWALLAILAVLCLAALALSLREPELFLVSVDATYQNVIQGRGLWGRSLVLLTLLIGISLLVWRSPQVVVVPSFPLLGFVPTAVLLAYLRDGAYRVGAGDSLNRMLMHFFLLALLIFVTAASGEPRLGRRRPIGSSRSW